jgi:hypothetical protein
LRRRDEARFEEDVENVVFVLMSRREGVNCRK